MVNKIGLTIIISIILTAIIISTVNVGTSLFLNEPDYNKYCAEVPVPALEKNATVAEIEAYNEEFRQCQDNWDEAYSNYNQHRFYIFATIGFILLLVGLLVKENLIQITGLATGGILVVEGIIMNLQNKLIVFISLIAILAIFGILAWRVVNKT